VFLEDPAPDHHVHETGLIFKGHEDHAGGGPGALPADDDPRVPNGPRRSSWPRSTACITSGSSVHYSPDWAASRFGRQPPRAHPILTFCQRIRIRPASHILTFCQRIKIRPASHLAGKQPIPAAGLTPTGYAVLWAANGDHRGFFSCHTDCFLFLLRVTERIMEHAMAP
jgi:hypothetical protein